MTLAELEIVGHGKLMVAIGRSQALVGSESGYTTDNKISTNTLTLYYQCCYIFLSYDPAITCLLKHSRLKIGIEDNHMYAFTKILYLEY